MPLNLHNPLRSLFTRFLQLYDHDFQDVKDFTEDILIPHAFSLDFTRPHNLSREDTIAIAPKFSVLGVALQCSFVQTLVIVAEHHGGLKDFGDTIPGHGAAWIWYRSVIFIG